MTTLVWKAAGWTYKSAVDGGMAPAPHEGSFLAWRRHHALPPGALCPNCGTVLAGPWCHACGQSGHDFHRHAHHLIAETFESFFHADGRLWRTLCRLVCEPARLTRDYIEGHRAPQIPPLRLFLVAVVSLFLVGSWTGGVVSVPQFGHDLTAEDVAELKKAHASLQTAHINLGLSKGRNTAAEDWLRVHAGRAMDHPDELLSAMGERSEDFAFLMLPIAALVMALMFVASPRFVLFDHLIFSMHSLSFLGLLIALSLAIRPLLGEVSTLLVLLAPVHLFAHMRGAYRISAAGTLVRMAILLVASSFGFFLLLAGLLFVGLRALRS